MYTIRRRRRVPLGPGEIFAFFERPQNLGLTTPARLDFRILTPGPIVMAPGLTIDYTIRVLGRRTRWRTLIAGYDPPDGFRDVQVTGPYRRRDHRHRFWREGGETVMEDFVTYEMPLGPIGALVHWLVVRRQLETTFDYRRRRIEDLLRRPGLSRPAEVGSPMEGTSPRGTLAGRRRGRSST